MTTVALPVARRAHQLGLEPGAAGQAFVADRLGVERPPAPGRLHQGGEVAAGAHRLGAAGGAEQVEIAPAGRADEADAAAAVVADDQALALEHRDAERLAAARAGPARRPSRSRPSNSWLPATNTTGCGQPAKRSSAVPLAVDVAGEDQQLGAGRRLGGRTARSRDAGRTGAAAASQQPRVERPASRRRGAGAVADLVLAAAAARAGVVAADLGRRPAHRLDLVARPRRQVVELGDADDQLLDRRVEGRRAAAPWRAGPRSLPRPRLRPAGSGRAGSASSPRRRRRARRGRGRCWRRTRSRRPRAGPPG